MRMVLLLLFLLFGPRTLVMHGEHLAGDGADVDLLHPGFPRHLDVEGVDQLAVLLLELFGAHLAARYPGEGGGAGRFEADLGLLGERGRNVAANGVGGEEAAGHREGAGETGDHQNLLRFHGDSFAGLVFRSPGSGRPPDRPAWREASAAWMKRGLKMISLEKRARPAP